MSDETDAKSDEGFAQRWSRLKAEAREPKPAPSVPAPSPGRSPEETAAPADLSKLPSIESLTKDSDYSMFLRADVPEDLRRQALRKLWASDPVFAVPDRLDMHNLDYNAVFAVSDAVKVAVQTAQQVADATSSPKQADTLPGATSAACESTSEVGPESPASGAADKNDRV